MVGPEHRICEGARSKNGNKFYVLAAARVKANFKEEVEDRRGVQRVGFEGKRYKPLFPFFADRAEKALSAIILEEAVSMEEGTGIVHAAPAFGEIDFFACKRENIELVCPVDSNGRFTAEVPPYAGAACQRRR